MLCLRGRTVGHTHAVGVWDDPADARALILVYQAPVRHTLHVAPLRQRLQEPLT